jgi:hypothetical protein
MSLDCRDPFGLAECNLTDTYLNNGYSRWPFFEYLAETYGNSFLTGVFAQGQAGAGSATAALAAALAAKGTTLAAAYNAWTTVQLTGAYTVVPLQTQKPTAYATIQTGSKTGALPVQRVSVNHLATRFLEYQRGDGDASEPCYSATLSLTVAMPAGTLSKPTFYWDGGGSSPVPLTVNGNTATATIPWDTCTRATGEAYLSLPNASTTIDAADFVVNATLTVDTTKPANAGAPPPPVSTWGQIVPVPTVQLAPSIYVYGPELLTVAPGDKQLRLIVQSSGDGSLQAAIGSTSLGSGTLRAGNNDLRFNLPASLLVALRRTADVSNTLTLTPVAPSGGNKGTAVMRQVLIQTPAGPTKPTTPAKPAKPKSKPKSKPKPKSKGHK